MVPCESICDIEVRMFSFARLFVCVIPEGLPRRTETEGFNEAAAAMGIIIAYTEFARSDLKGSQTVQIIRDSNLFVGYQDDAPAAQRRLYAEADFRIQPRWSLIAASNETHRTVCHTSAFGSHFNFEIQARAKDSLPAAKPQDT